MSGLVLDHLVKRYGPFTAVHDAELTIPHGRFVCLLGPSGCGKTTLLRMIAGLEAPSAGAIRLDGEDITAKPAHQRDFGMVFQSLALFPHLTVGENIAYPLRIRGKSRAEQRAEAERLLALVRLPGAADRPVAKLSGGQRQRVAIARALALSPRLFLLDEPLSALDAKLREAMQIELKQLQQRLGITTIVVTHDQREAMTMADLVVVMSAGRIHQAAPPVEVYRRPADAFVADFIGMTNLLKGKVAGPGRVAVAGGTLAVTDPTPAAGEVVLSVRPEDVAVRVGDDAPNLLPGTVTFLRDLGATVEIRLDVAGQEIVAVTAPQDRPMVQAGDAVHVRFPAEAAVVLAS
ncbi:ABC transporter ATP-binding protein [Zavarzinia compransoris]|uniref:Polyamine ABC transporter ATP-binding protein n=1 Tax=Zavarzinia compransoris TaxID=1264899 RepID=A0A317E3I9_9PROT|nr:ABC transporter ATP-binding protein [Zavarzinia compransoris]PWR20716.1 polyamine ABC transporter ATP-binding protein [Zavarzinia compransoris]TDP44457.1 putative spermidine/putrescine transport system ATP-binding protein [Zavarzinia compransoris]